MRIQRKWTTSIDVRPDLNASAVPLLPGNIIDVTDWVYRGLKDSYGSNVELLDNEDIVQVSEKTIATAGVLAMNSVPVQLVTAPGAGKAILVDKVITSLTYNSVAYGTNTDLEIRYDSSTAGDAGGAEVTLASFDTILTLTSNTIAVCNGTVWASDETNVTQNKGVTAKVATGNPTAGNSPITIKTYYKVVSI